jgi:hypothetical protein
VTSRGLASLMDGRKFLQKLHAADCLHVSWSNIPLFRMSETKSLITRGEYLTVLWFVLYLKLVGDRAEFHVDVGNTEGNLDCFET